MTFQDSIKTCLTQKYVGFSGRATRSEYWWFCLAMFLIGIVLGIVSSMLSILVSLATLLPSLAVAVRRLHDTNRTGWWLLIALIPLIGTIILIVFLVQPGGDAENQYGPAPQITPA